MGCSLSPAKNAGRSSPASRSEGLRATGAAARSQSSEGMRYGGAPPMVSGLPSPLAKLNCPAVSPSMTRFTLEQRMRECCASWSAASSMLWPVSTMSSGRDTWYAGSAIVNGQRVGPPLGIRSVTATPDGVLLVNVHVGGIVRSSDGGITWQPTIDIDTDVHQVCAHPTDPRMVGRGLRGRPVHKPRCRNDVDHRAGGTPWIALLGGSVFRRRYSGVRGGEPLRGSWSNLSAADRNPWRAGARRGWFPEVGRRYHRHRLHRQHSLNHCGGRSSWPPVPIQRFWADLVRWCERPANTEQRPHLLGRISTLPGYAGSAGQIITSADTARPRTAP